MDKELEEVLQEIPIDYHLTVMKQASDLSWGEFIEIECPKCNNKLFIARSEYNGHLFAKCETDNCIWIMQ